MTKNHPAREKKQEGDETVKPDQTNVKVIFEGMMKR